MTECVLFLIIYKNASPANNSKYYPEMKQTSFITRHLDKIGLKYVALI